MDRMLVRRVCAWFAAAQSPCRALARPAVTGRAMEMPAELQKKIFPPAEQRHIVLDGLKDKRVAVIGDVHGCLDELLELVGLCEADHLVFVGDMINKGPKNAETLEYIRGLTNAAFIRGNHEDAVLAAYFTRKTDPTFKEHMAWVDGLKDDDVAWLVALPFTISLPEFNALVVHAGLVPDLPLAEQMPHHMTTMRNLLTHDGKYVATSKDEEGSVAWASVWSGTQHVYFGHDAKRKLQLHPHATGLDSGCVYGFKLTACVLPEKRLVTVDAKAVHCPPGQRGGGD